MTLWYVQEEGASKSRRYYGVWIWPQMWNSEPGIEFIPPETKDRLFQILNTRLLHPGLGQENRCRSTPYQWSNTPPWRGYYLLLESAVVLFLESRAGTAAQ